MAAARRVVDTSAWIEWLTGSALGKKLAREFPDKPLGIVPNAGGGGGGGPGGGLSRGHYGSESFLPLTIAHAPR